MPDKFIKYHEQNPHIYELFKKYSLMAIGRGFKRFSAKAIFERLRWHYSIETTGDPYLLNNNYTAYYARKLMNEGFVPQGFFELRTRRNAA